MGPFILGQLDFLLRIVVAALCGAMIGYERTNRMKSAGIRTHLIVSIAAALMMVVSKHGFDDVLGRTGMGLDPSRIAAGVVSAVGFLGAGVIFVRKQNVSGITTAAGIWATVGVGMAIGAGMYVIGIAVAVLIVVVQVLLHKTSRFSKEPMSEQIVLELQGGDDPMRVLHEVLESRHIDVVSFKAKKLEKERLEIRLLVRYPEQYDVADILRLLNDIPNVKSVEI